ncbi:tetratricopeptide repeat-containing sensor histidine kinase [Polaribacter septentrionalilitoris]|uniref:tetratricopeptide repeat-containing sensor histidine kinase n=1 Tax=Polaribacter septentrionalilitoris TaxID=2494657 RepID=UPI0013578317|nr:sensor histidine kinase [Polaribacter septentrionalilitoris]
MMKLSKEVNNDSLIIYSFNLKGDILLEKFKYNASLESFNTAIKLNEDYTKLKAYSFNGLGNNYSKFESFEEATKSFLKALELFEKVKDTFMIIGTNIHLANDFRKLRDYENSENYYLKALKINNNKNEFLDNFVYNNLSDLYNDMNKPELSIQNAKKALAYFKKMNFERYLAYPYYNMAVSYNKINNDNLAENYFLKAIKIHIKFDNQSELANSFNGLSTLYLENKDYDKAIESSLKSLEYSKKNNLLEFQISSYKLLTQAYINKNNFKLASNSFKKYDSVKNDFYEEKKLKITKQLSEKYQSEKKEKELLKARTEKAETELALTKSKGWIFILMASLLIAVFLFFGISQRIKRKNQEAIVKEKERGFKAIIDAQEEERSKIARELHDGVVQQIGSVILKARNLFTKKELTQDNESKEVLQRLENSNQDLRNISHQMMPRALKELGVISALNDLLEGSLSYANIKYSLEHFNIEERLPEKIEVTIYRIVQELINNIIKHSKATEVSVQLFNANNTVILIVEDNGVGFAKEKNKKGIGLLNISSRLDIVNGNVNFEPSPKSGTLVTIKIPLK